MSGILSKWVVLHEYAVAPSDLDDAGALPADVIAGWMATARADYLDRCPRLAALGKDATWDFRTVGVTALTGEPDLVVVTATAAEVRPAALTLSLRARGDERVVNARSIIRLIGADGEAIELGTPVRDELIALEHAAEHYN